MGMVPHAGLSSRGAESQLVEAGLARLRSPPEASICLSLQVVEGTEKERARNGSRCCSSPTSACARSYGRTQVRGNRLTLGRRQDPAHHQDL